MQKTKELCSNNKRLAKNTFMLYIRMGVTMVVGLYTSRVVLQVLGITDYGIYGVVGGIVSFIGFLNSSMSGATSRFLTYELGAGNKEKLQQTFVSAFWVHLIIGLIVLVLAETIGIWFLYNKLVIPESRMNAAFWTYQFSVAATFVSITQVPYNASVISHEDMDIYAYVEIVNIFLKLFIAYFLLYVTADKLILYSLLYFLISFLIAMYYRWYCINKYEEAHITKYWDKVIVGKLLKFCSWDLYGNGCFIAKQQGINFLVNMFYGVALNASISIASAVSGTLFGFTGNIVLALRPQIIKKYAQGDYISMQNIISQGIKYIILLQSCCTIPFVLEADYVFDLWLDTVPPSAVLFCQWMFVAALFSACNGIITVAIHATGQIKRLSYISGTISIIQLPILYLLFLNGQNPEWAFILGVFGGILMVVINIFIAKRLVPSLFIADFFKAIFISFLIVFIVSIPFYILRLQLDSSFVRVLLITSGYIITLALMTYVFILPLDIKNKISIKLSVLLKEK